MIRIGIDTGGTFTDFVVDDGVSTRIFKLPSTPQNPAAVLLQALARIEKPFSLAHGTTVATNAILERKLAKTAFITNEGFCDLLFLARQTRPDIYAMEPRLPAPPVSREDCFAAPGRLLSDGTELSALDLDALPDLSSYEAIAVCLLFAYANPEHELRLKDKLPGDVFISLSHEVSPQFREYERAMATVLNASVGPLMRRYLMQIDNDSGAAQCLIMSSGGGLINMNDAADMPIRTITSGPAGGVAAATELCKRLGRRRAIAFDMGGTSTDVCLIDGEPAHTSLTEIDGLPIRLPRVDVHTIGCGGGSIARLDSAGALQVGPESAGAEPGPAIYGRGDSLTVTDANVLLGRLPLERFNLSVDVPHASRVARLFASEIGRDAEEVCEAIVMRAEANMAAAIRKVSSEKGRDPADFALIAYGGSGPLHACAIASELGISEVLVPLGAGVFSAYGLLLAPKIWEESVTVLGKQRGWEEVFDGLKQRAIRRLGQPAERIVMSAEFRYKGQSHEISVSADGDERTAMAEFEKSHHETLGISFPDGQVEWVAARVRAEVRQPGPPRLEVKQVPASKSSLVRNREELREADALAAGTIVLASDCTILIPPGWHGAVLDDGTMRISRTGR